MTADSPLGELPLLEKELLGRGFTPEAAEGDGLTLRYSCQNSINPTDFRDAIIITTDGEGRVMGVGGTFLSSWSSSPSEGTGGCRFMAELWKQAVMRDLNLVKGVEGSGIFAVQVKQEFCQEEKIGGHWKLAQIGGGLSSFGATEVKLFRNE